MSKDKQYKQMKMASRSSQRHRKQISRLIDEVHFGSQGGSQQSMKNLKRNVRDDKFYDIEIKEIEAVSKKVKVHYIGYADKYDEWKDFDESSEFPVVKLEKVEPADETVEERAALFSRRLYLEVKRRLRSTRKDDPEVRLELPIAFDVFRHTFDGIGELAADSGKHSKIVKNNDDLVPVLGSIWYIRVKNLQGDFEVVVDSSIRFWLLGRPPLDDFIFIGGQLFPYKIEQDAVLVFKFIRQAGNLRQLKEHYGL